MRDEAEAEAQVEVDVLIYLEREDYDAGGESSGPENVLVTGKIVSLGQPGLRASHLRGQQVLRQVGGLVVGLPDRLMIPGPDEGRIINLKSQSKTDISIFCILL